MAGGSTGWCCWSWRISGQRQRSVRAMTPYRDQEHTGPPFVYRAIIFQPARPQILLLPGENGWVLPSEEISRFPNWQDVHHVNQSVMDTLGLDVRVLRC